MNGRQKALLYVGYTVGCFNTHIATVPSEPAETVVCVQVLSQTPSNEQETEKDLMHILLFTESLQNAI